MLIDKDMLKNMAENVPCYCFDTVQFCENVKKFKAILGPEVGLVFSVKANPFFIEAAMNTSDGIEICSAGELFLADKNGADPERITYSGICKEQGDLQEAIQYGVRRFSVESEYQLRMLEAAAAVQQVKIDALLRVSSGNQFGMSVRAFNECVRSFKFTNTKITGIHFYPGTMRITDKAVDEDFTKFVSIMNVLDKSLIHEISYGAGIGFDYYKKHDQWSVAKRIAERLKGLSGRYKITYEAGRLLSADAGIYIARVAEVRENDGRLFVILNGGRHQFTYHGGIINLGMRTPKVSIIGNSKAHKKMKVTIVGALCNESDILANDIEIPEIEEGDYIAFHNAGAYCLTEGSALFLSRDIPAVFFSDGKTVKIKRKKNINRWIRNLY